MRDLVFLAWKYVSFHRWKTAISSFAVALCIFTPLAVELVVSQFESILAERALTTPLVIGSKGSRFDLAFHAMHFKTSPPTTCTMADWQMVSEAKMNFAIPIHCQFQARGISIVGIGLEYWEFRKLEIAKGSNLKRLGDCVLGANAAKRLKLAPNDKLLSDAESVFDFAGSYPLEMRVVGILGESGSPDDDAVFVDIKTSWVIAGLGHGHEDLQVTQESNILNRTDRQITAADSLFKFTRITDENVSQFHFHGDSSSYPLTAIIADPSDDRSETLLEGRFVDPKMPTQVVRPAKVFDEVMTIVVRMKELIQLVGGLLIVTTVLYFLVVCALTRKIRQPEIATMQKLGCSRRFTALLQVVELGFVMLLAALMACVMLLIVKLVASTIVFQWLSSM
jgi:putative ABC transport system permease protein